VVEGSQGPRVPLARVRVWESRSGLPGVIITDNALPPSSRTSTRRRHIIVAPKALAGFALSS
jgi:hypothetical protein